MKELENLAHKIEALQKFALEQQAIHGRIWDAIIFIVLGLLGFLLYHISAMSSRKNKEKDLYKLLQEIKEMQIKEVQYREEQLKIQEIEKEHWITEKKYHQEQITFLHKRMDEFEKKSQI